MARTKAKRRIRVYTQSDDGTRVQRRSDLLAAEEPLEIVLSAGGEQRTVAITMRTPGNDYELTAGFLFAEGIIATKRDIDTITYCVSDGVEQTYNQLRISLSAHHWRGALSELPQLDRHFFTSSACGICGTTVLDDLSTRFVPLADDVWSIDAATLVALPNALRAEQSLFAQTGGLHAAALFDRDGALLAVREDVGRHNAFDKLVGWGLLNGHLPFRERAVLVSGRASYELLQKCLASEAPLLAAVSAPSSLAADVAARFNITLVGFLREQRFNLYTGAKRIAER